MTRRNVLVAMVAAFACSVMAQTSTRPAPRAAQGRKKTMVVPGSARAGATMVSEERDVAGPADKAKPDKAPTSKPDAPPKTSKAPPSRESSGKSQGASDAERSDEVRSGTRPSPSEAVRVQEPTRIELSAPATEPRGGSGSGEVSTDHGRGGRGRRGGGGGHCGRPHHDFDYWRHGWRHSHHHASWGFHWCFGPIVYPVPVYVPSVVRHPSDRYGVYIRATGNDIVGSSFARELREQLRQEGLTVVYDDDQAELELYLVSMDRSPDESGYGSAVSVSYIWYPGHRFITAQLLDVGADQVVDLADDVAGYAHDLMDDYR